jgi:hypothetical protein
MCREAVKEGARGLGADGARGRRAARLLLMIYNFYLFDRRVRRKP